VGNTKGGARDIARGGERRPGDIGPPAEGRLTGDRGIGCEGMKSVPWLPLEALTEVKLLFDGARFRCPVGAVLGRKGVFNLGSRITERAEICACRESANAETLVGGDFLSAVMPAGRLSGCRGLIDKGAEDSSLVPMLSKECVEDNGADPTGSRVTTGLG
jgi:hypothetical protein